LSAGIELDISAYPSDVLPTWQIQFAAKPIKVLFYMPPTPLLYSYLHDQALRTTAIRHVT
jgi:hypothetical protein